VIIPLSDHPPSIHPPTEFCEPFLSRKKSGEDK
jgi:hypothetical protein